MGSEPLTSAQMKELNDSYMDSSQLLTGIYQNIKDWKEHHMQDYSEGAHRGFEELKRNIENLLPFRLASFQSPASIKHRKRKANWRTPRSPNLVARARVNNARNATARNARANAPRLGSAPGGTMPYNANANNLG
jgi:hypothetical protein